MNVVLETIITSSVLILVITVLRFILKGKISLRLQYALWVLVVIRLLMPFPFFSSSVSVMNIVNDVSYTAISAPANNYVPPNYTPITIEQDKINTSFVQPIVTTFNAVDMFRTIWYVGIGTLAFCLIFSNMLFFRRIKDAAERIELPNCPLPVYKVKGLASPCLFGLFSPSIYLTPESFDNEERMTHILTHELTHKKHLDHIWVYVRGLCLCIYWFNPLVWIAAILSKRDSELACDESSLILLGEENRVAYGRTLISMIPIKNNPANLFHFATTMTGGNHNIKERILLIAEKPRMLLITLISVLIITATTIGCTFTGSKVESSTEISTTDSNTTFNSSSNTSLNTAAKNTIEKTQNSSNRPENVSVRFLAEGDIPEFVKEWAIERTERVLSGYNDVVNEGGVYDAFFVDAKVSALTKVVSTTMNSTDDLQMWKLEYRLLPEDPTQVVMTGGMRMEDGWLTENSSYGQPFLVVVHHMKDDRWERIGETNDQNMARYKGGFSEAVISMYNMKMNPGLINNLISNLFDMGNFIEIGIVVDGKAYNNFVNYRGYAERLDVLMSSYNWSLIDSSDNTESLTSLYAKSPYYITIWSTGRDIAFTFFAGSNKVCYHRLGGVESWYSLDGNVYIAEDIRLEYDNLNVNYKNIVFNYDGTATDAAELFTSEIFKNHLLNLVPGSSYGINDYKVVDWGIDKVKEDGSAVLGWFKYAVVPKDYNSPGLWAGNTYEGDGDLKGWLIMYRQFVLEKQMYSFWHCVDLGTGGASLP